MCSSSHTIRIVLAVLILVGTLAACGDLLVNSPHHDNNVADFERAWAITDSVYPYFQFKRINWDSIHTVYAPRAEAAQGDEGFQLLFDLLAELKDGHVDLRNQRGQEVRTYTPPRTNRDRMTFDPHLVHKYFTEDLKVAGGNRMEYGILPDGNGYIRIVTFENGSWIYEFHSVLAYLKDTRGLIVDVRDNGGGSTNMSDIMVSRFITLPLPYYPVYIQGKPQNTHPVQPLGPFTYTKPVVVLINGVCFSTTESFAEMMRQIQNVTVVGDTTGGGGGAPEYFSLPSGREIRVSTKDLRRYDGMPVEWNGIPPDIVVMQTRDDVKNGHDLQFERAIRLLQ
jgi:C-terminal processing protease CtpA/Prc